MNQHQKVQYGWSVWAWATWVGLVWAVPPILAQPAVPSEPAAPPAAATAARDLSSIRSNSPGYGFLKKGWVNDAIAAFEASLQRSPNDLQERLGLAMAYQKAGRDAQAWQAYQQVLQQAPDTVLALEAAGTLGGYRSEWQAAGIEALTRLLVIDSNHLGARRQRALLLGYQGRHSEAIADYQILLRSPEAQSDPALLVSAAQVHAYGGQYSAALDLFDQARSLGAKLSDDALDAAGIALRESGQGAQAIALLQPRVEALPPPSASTGDSDLNLRTTLALAYAAQKQWKPAEETLAPLRPLPQAQRSLARALLVLGQGQPNPALRQEAIERYRQLLQASQTPSLLQEAAAALASQPQTQGEALELYDQLLAIAPAQGGEIPLQRLLLAYQLGRVNASQLPELLQAQLANLPDGADRQRVALALRGLAGVKFSQGEYGEAARLYQQVLAVRPGDFDTLQALADLHLAQDHPLAALQQLQANFQQLRGKSEAVTPQVQQLSDRIVEVKVERLKRRGFQPAWERY